MTYCWISEPDKLLQLGTTQQIEDRVIGWLGTLQDAGKATPTMKGALASVAFFYSCTRVKLDTNT